MIELINKSKCYSKFTILKSHKLNGYYSITNKLIFQYKILKVIFIIFRILIIYELQL